MEKNLILEIGTEEIPARFMERALSDIASFAAEEFAEKRIAYGHIDVYGTPRRLVLSVRSVAERQNDLVEEFKGPSCKSAFDMSGEPTRAAKGFAKGKGIDVSDLQIRTLGKADYVFAVINHKGEDTSALLPEMMKSIITRLVFPKNMYWVEPNVRFARPIRWLLCLLGSDVVDFELNGMKSGRTSHGHRFMGAKLIDIPNADAYLDKMYDNNVIVDQKKREEKMRATINRIELELDGKAELDPALIRENLYLVEYPVPFYGTFDKKYLQIPEEVLTTSMKDNQKYFAMHDRAGRLMPCFIGVSNNVVPNPALVREGNERVLRARLEDAVFFWQEDLKKPLASRVEDLKNVTYQEKLGSVYDKTLKVVDFAEKTCGLLGLSAEETALAKRAAYLAKADLVTGMVGEFPELQGIMGREYAAKSGENPRVAKAIAEQYMPANSGSALPTDKLGAIVGTAERVFNMVGAYKLGLQPTGSQDPYGLRRAVRCANECIWGLGLDFDIGSLLEYAAGDLGLDADQLTALLDFIKTRTQIQLKEKGYAHDLVDLAQTVTKTRHLQTLRLLEAFTAVRNESWYSPLVNSAVRVKNILAKAENVPSAIDPSLFAKDAESALHSAICAADAPVAEAMAKDDWSGLMNVLAGLSPAVAAFFDDVMVMDDDLAIRANRLALLSQCNGLFMRVGDLSKAK